ncbi:hypothetical protein P4S84_18240 [Aneurinibacillus aneurinilyticus]|uniref:Mu transposase domain-containing protein n=1 Tax=Aneurinibacillus aneurinilyticus TaxID=1391 RepID=UPI002E1CF6FF|nr:hypothetical protein [Aneurinibacillus aneurinilyticus]
MAEINYIRHEANRKGSAYTEIVKKLECDPRTVKKYAEMEDFSPETKPPRVRGARVMEAFQNFVLHYEFTPEFCNPGSGNEKGHVESMVKYIRNNFLLPELTLLNLENLNQTLWKKAEKDQNRKHYQKEKLIAKLYMADQEQFLQLSAKEFDCVRYEEVKADKYGYIQIDNKTYLPSPRFAKQKVLAKISYNQVELLTEKYDLIVSHERLYGEQKQSVKWQPYLSLMAKRPMVIKYISFYEQLPKERQTYLEQCIVHEKQQATLPKVAGTPFDWKDIKLGQGLTREYVLHGGFIKNQENLIFYGGSEQARRF